MVSVNNVTVEFGGSALFDDISFLINSRDRIGLAGKNGAGKSTLLKMIIGEQRPTSGEIAKANNYTIGYLAQDITFRLGRTIFEEASSAFEEIKTLEKKIADYTHQLETRTDYESDDYSNVINKLNDASERMNIIGGYTFHEKVELVLMGLGFERTDFDRLTDVFSGGWRMRVELAKILLQNPDLILLDEPTNHLDIESIQWLEDFLKNHAGAVMMVSHDKTFLDSITTRTIEISLGRIYDYKANYSKYLMLRKERREQQEAAAKNQQKYIDKTQKLIDQYRAKASKASFAQSLIKKLDKIEVIEVDESDNSTLKLRFPEAERSGKVTVESDNVKKQYGEKVVFGNVDFMIERGEKIAFVGKNGEGKTTMIKLIVGQEQLSDGKLTVGHNVNIGYYAQNQAETLDNERTVFQTIDDVAVGEIRKNVRSLLGSFMFGGDDIDKKVKVLSGGEKARLAMCKLLLQPYNLLILDEPTNHLDLKSKDILKQALIKYDGTMIVVSHDRDFLQGLTNKVYEFRHGNVKQHIGDVNEYIANRKIDSLKELNKKPEITKPEIRNPKPETNKETEIQREKEKELKNLQNQVTKSEKEIENLETKIKEFDAKLNDPEQYKVITNDPKAFGQYEDLKKKLETEMKKWEELTAKIS